MFKKINLIQNKNSSNDYKKLIKLLVILKFNSINRININQCFIFINLIINI